MNVYLASQLTNNVIGIIISSYLLLGVLLLYPLAGIRGLLVDLFKLKIPTYADVLIATLAPVPLNNAFIQSAIFEREYWVFSALSWISACVIVITIACVLCANHKQNKNKPASHSHHTPPRIDTNRNPENASSRGSLESRNTNIESFRKIETITHAIPPQDPSISNEIYIRYRNARKSYNIRTLKGDYVRSIAEKKIADKLYTSNLPYEYERPLHLGDGITVYPSFSITINTSGKRVFWEHLPPMNDPYTQKHWTQLKSIYIAHNIHEEKNLILTTEDIDSFDMLINELISTSAKYRKDTPQKPQPHLRTARGDYVRSRNEQLIADSLFAANISYEYEKPVMVGDILCHPDFTIIRPWDGKILFWEHCGMMDIPKYRAKWQRKKMLYKMNNISEGNNLIVTYNQISEKQISKIIETLVSCNFLTH